jgi:hypothetical protein
MTYANNCDLLEYLETHCKVRRVLSRPEEVHIECLNPDCPAPEREILYINTERGVGKCHYCEMVFRTVDIVALIEGVSISEAWKIIKGNGFTFQRCGDSKDKGLKNQPREVRLPRNVPLTPGTPGYRYLVGREFTPEVFDHFNLGYCESGYYRDRIIIPVYHNGKLVSFQTRACDPKEAKRYLFPAGVDSQALYNWDHARKFESVILVEGVTDAWRVWLAGYRNVMATFGKSLKPGQIELLTNGDHISHEWNYGPEERVDYRHDDHIKKIIIMWDGDAVNHAHQAGKRLLGFGKDISIVELPTGMQPDTCPDIEAALRRRVRVRRWI